MSNKDILSFNTLQSKSVHTVAGNITSSRRNVNCKIIHVYAESSLAIENYKHIFADQIIFPNTQNIL